ncbi:MAG: response regulator [Polaribacter sp.]|uniref:response regulator n=1 Tax=Polaribacter sp. TaxID=1920175 RepID=UPI003BAF8692
MLNKVIIIEDEMFALMHLKKIISSLGYTVVETYYNAEDFLNEPNWNFDVAIVDILLSGKLTGLDVAKEIKKKRKPFIFLTANQDSFTINEAAKLAPAAYLSKPFQNAEVEAALIMLKLKIKPNNLDPYFVFLSQNEHTIAPLTIREVDVLKNLIENSSTEIIAEKLFISKNTVKTHIRNLYLKFTIKNKEELLEKVKNIF